MNENELYHYGVKGMKWGVRRDTRILANHRYNRTAEGLKTLYDSGRITARQHDDALRIAKNRKKKFMSDVKESFKNTSSKEERDALGKTITDMAIKEVPDIKIHRGMAIANQALGIASLGKIGATAVTSMMINPAFAGAYLGAGAITVAAEAGWRYLTRLGLDKLS